MNALRSRSSAEFHHLKIIGGETGTQYISTSTPNFNFAA